MKPAFPFLLGRLVGLFEHRLQDKNWEHMMSVLAVILASSHFVANPQVGNSIGIFFLCLLHGGRVLTVSSCGWGTNHRDACSQGAPITEGGHH